MALLRNAALSLCLLAGTAAIPAPAEAQQRSGSGYAEMPPELRLMVQDGLTWSGDYVGTIDGRIGPSTVRAVRQFQRKFGARPTGVLTADQLGSLLAHADAAKAGLGYSAYRDPATGIEIGLPLALAPRTGESEGGSRFASADGGIEIELFRLGEDEGSLRRLYDDAHAVPGREVTYDRFGRSWFVVTGIEGSREFYTRARRTGDGFEAFAIVYDTALAEKVEPAIVAMSSAFARPNILATLAMPAPEETALATEPVPEAPPPDEAPAAPSESDGRAGAAPPLAAPRLADPDVPEDHGGNLSEAPPLPEPSGPPLAESPPAAEGGNGTRTGTVRPMPDAARPESPPARTVGPATPSSGEQQTAALPPVQDLNPDAPQQRPAVPTEDAESEARPVAASFAVSTDGHYITDATVASCKAPTIGNLDPAEIVGVNEELGLVLIRADVLQGALPVALSGNGSKVGDPVTAATAEADLITGSVTAIAEGEGDMRVSGAAGLDTGAPLFGRDGNVIGMLAEPPQSADEARPAVPARAIETFLASHQVSPEVAAASPDALSTAELSDRVRYQTEMVFCGDPAPAITEAPSR